MKYTCPDCGMIYDDLGKPPVYCDWLDCDNAEPLEPDTETKEG